MEKVKLNYIKKNANTISYDFSTSAGLIQFFSKKSLIIEYQESIEEIPDAIAAIPFVCNVLPIIWLTDSELILSELDKVFYECLPEVKKGYETMFPESMFAGNICVGKVVECDIPSTGKSAAFFSGGVDSVQTLISHLEEKPDLISIWGSDIQYDNVDGWALVHSAITEATKRFHLSDIVIHSNFREFDNEALLDSKFHNQLKDGWWHGVKHGIGLLGHVAPYAYQYGLSKIYIASSNCPDDGKVRCASNPLIDNHVCFANCKVIHDGFEYSRQDKLHNIVEFCHTTQSYFPLHVCWQSQKGSNCCHCEKCYRTIAGLLAEGEKPEGYGFKNVDLSDMQRCIVESGIINSASAKQWMHIQKRIGENKKFLQGEDYWKYIRWILYANFNHFKSLKMPFNYRIRRKLSHYRFYQCLHQLRRKE